MNLKDGVTSCSGRVAHDLLLIGHVKRQDENHFLE